MENREQFAVDNFNLIYAFIQKYGVDYKYDEIIDLLYIGYTKALNTYDSSKGKFSTYAYSCMSGICSGYDYMYNRRAKRSKDIKVVSLNTPVGEQKDNELWEFIKDPNVDIETEVEFKLLLEDIYNSKELLPDSDQYLFECYFEKNFTMERIAKSLGVSKERIRQRINKLITKLRDYTNGINFMTADTMYRDFSNLELAKAIFKGSGIV